MPTIEEDYPGLADSMDLIRGEIALQMGDSYSEDEFQNYARQHIQKWIRAQNKAGFSYNEINETVGLRGNEKGQGLLETIFGDGFNRQFQRTGEEIGKLPTWTGLPQARAGFNRIAQEGAGAVEKVGQLGGYGAKYLSLANAKKQLELRIDPRTNQYFDPATLTEQDRAEILAEITDSADRSLRVGLTAGQVIPSPWGPTPGEQFAKEMGQEKPGLMAGAKREEEIFGPAGSLGLNLGTIGANVFDLTSILGGGAKAAVKAERLAKLPGNVDVPGAPLSKFAEKEISDLGPLNLGGADSSIQKARLPVSEPPAAIPPKFKPVIAPEKGPGIPEMPGSSMRPRLPVSETGLPANPTADIHRDLVEKLRLRSTDPLVNKGSPELKARGEEIKSLIETADPKKFADLVKKLSPEVEKLPPEIKADVLAHFKGILEKRVQGLQDQITPKKDITAKTATPGLDPTLEAQALKNEEAFQAETPRLAEGLNARIAKDSDLGPTVKPETVAELDEIIRSSGGTVIDEPAGDLSKLGFETGSVKAEPGRMPGSITDSLDPAKADPNIRLHYQNWLKKNKLSDTKQNLDAFMNQSRKRSTKGSDRRAPYMGARKGKKQSGSLNVPDFDPRDLMKRFPKLKADALSVLDSIYRRGKQFKLSELRQKLGKSGMSRAEQDLAIKELNDEGAIDLEIAYDKSALSKEDFDAGIPTENGHLTYVAPRTDVLSKLKKFASDEGGSIKYNTGKWEEVDDAEAGTITKVPGKGVVDSTRYLNEELAGRGPLNAPGPQRDYMLTGQSPIDEFGNTRFDGDFNMAPVNPAAFPDRLPMGDRQGELVRPRNKYGEELDTGKMRAREREAQDHLTQSVDDFRRPVTNQTLATNRQLVEKLRSTQNRDVPGLKDLVKRFYSNEEGEFDFGAASDLIAKTGKAGINATVDIAKKLRGNSYERAIRAELKGSTKLALADARKLFFENSHLPANERALLAKDKFEADVKFAVKESKRKIKELFPTLSDEGVNAAVLDYEKGLPTWSNIQEWSKAGRNLWPEAVGKLVNSLTTGSRKVLTVYNPGIHLPNIAGGITFFVDAGGNMAYLGKNSKRIWSILLDRENPLHRMFLKKGILGTEMAQRSLPLELRKALENEKDPQKLLVMMHDLESRIGDTWITGKLLNMPDQFIKVGLALQASELGIRNGWTLQREVFKLADGTPDWDKAARHVLDFTPSYDTIHPFINKVFGSTGAALVNHPFIKFPIENARIKKNVLMSRPTHALLSRGTGAALLAGMWGAAAAHYNLSPDFSSGWQTVKDEYNRQMKNPNNKGKVLVPKPWHNEKGKIEFWDMTYLFPSGGLVKNIKQKGLGKGLAQEFMGGGLLNRQEFSSAETRTDPMFTKIAKKIPAARAARDLYRGDRSVGEVLGLRTNAGGNPVIAGAKANARERTAIMQDINSISDPTKYKLTPEERAKRRKDLLRELSRSVKGGK